MDQHNPMTEIQFDHMMAQEKKLKLKIHIIFLASSLMIHQSRAAKFLSILVYLSYLPVGFEWNWKNSQ